MSSDKCIKACQVYLHFRMGTERWIYTQIDHLWNLNLKLTLKKICLFLTVLGLCCCTWAVSSCRERRLLCSCGEQTYCGGFSGCGAPALRTRASGAAASWFISVVHELRCSVARGLFPDQGLNPRHPHEQALYLTTGPPGKSEKSTFPAWSLNM